MNDSIRELQARAKEVFAENGYICIRLEDEREIRFPASKNRRLRNASPEQLGNIELICNGTGLHWPDLDEDLSVIGIIEGRFGMP
jgi:Protein of unknown function (DUF2442)